MKRDNGRDNLLPAAERADGRFMPLRRQMLRGRRLVAGLSSVSLVMVALVGAGAEPAIAQSTNPPAGSLCPAPVLARLTRYQTRAGDTIVSLARRYNLTPETLVSMNPALRRGNPSAGTTLQIPPINGIRVDVPSGRSWRDLAQQYRVRADVLFEANGCRAPGRVAFIPGATSESGATAAAMSAANPGANAGSGSRIINPERAAAVLRSHPLDNSSTSVLKGYGWQVDSLTGRVVFNSGVDLAVAQGTPVVAAGEGVVAFAANQGNYGNLVVINHPEGLQTRYAQLGTIQVQVGQRVQAGDRLGTIGAAEPDPSFLRFEVRSNSDLGWIAQDPSLYFRDMQVGR